MSKCKVCPARNLCNCPEDSIVCKRFLQFVQEHTDAIVFLKELAKTDVCVELKTRELLSKYRRRHD